MSGDETQHPSLRASVSERSNLGLDCFAPLRGARNDRWRILPLYRLSQFIRLVKRVFSLLNIALLVHSFDEHFAPEFIFKDIE